MKKQCTLLAILFCAITAMEYTATAKPIVADISSHEIKITSDFNGITLLIYGARIDPGDIIVVIRGPDKDFIVRKKERVWGIWVNRYSKTIKDIPNYYTISSGKPLADIKGRELQRIMGIGTQNVIGNLDKDPFREALRQHLVDASLLSEASSDIQFIGETLFKTTIRFPSNLPRGNYTAEAYLMADGNIVGMQATPIKVYKSGFDAFMYDASKNHRFFYGLAAVCIALFSGWLASEVFLRMQ